VSGDCCVEQHRGCNRGCKNEVTHIPYSGLISDIAAGCQTGFWGCHANMTRT
jgi:hypothetical protein